MTTRLRTTEENESGWNYGLWRSAFHDVTKSLGASYVAYNQRVVPARFHRDRFEEYWALRRGVVMTDVSAEKTTEIAGPDAQVLMDRVMPRKMTTFKVSRAMYGVLCRPNGGVLCDGVLLRPSPDRFWSVR
jgi:glycine cleavage system aminomethyltransferase T